MANPQPENGYTKIANEILEAIAEAQLNGTQFRILTVIWRYTYGFNRKSHKLSLSFISNATKIYRQQVKREIDSLIEQNIITVSEEPGFGKTRELAFNKDYSQWGCTLKRVQGAKKSTVLGLEDKLYSKKSTPPVLGLEYQERKIFKEKYKESIYTVFEHWNTKKITQHRTMTQAMESAINARLTGKYDLSEILEAIDNYSTILTSDKYYYSHRFTITEFMNPKNIDRFMTDNKPFENFIDKNKVNGNGSPKQTDDDKLKLLKEWTKNDKK